MSNILSEVLRLNAIHQNKVLQYSSQRRMKIQNNALLWTSFTLPGKDSSILAMLIGSRGEKPHFNAIVDLYDPVSQVELFADAGDILAKYFEECKRNETFPQILLPSSLHINHLSTIAMRASSLQNNESLNRSSLERARMFGRLLWYFVVERRYYAGQQAILDVPAILTSHFAYPLPSNECLQLPMLRAMHDMPFGDIEKSRQRAWTHEVSKPIENIISQNIECKHLP